MFLVFGSYAFVMGIISGYPMGAKIVTNFRENNLCTKEEGERLLAFTNNSGPLFIIGTVGITLFGNSMIGFLLFITHLLACITVGFLFRFWKRKSHTTNLKNYSPKVTYQATFSNLGEILSKSILSAIQTVVMIGGFVVLFSVILSILQNSKILNILSTAISPFFQMFGINNQSFSLSFTSGMIELTNGVSLLAAIPYKALSVNIILAAFLLGFGGISILLQVFSITSRSDVSIKPYILGKLMQGLFAALYTYIFISTFPILNLNL